jgi:hypothetical protein
MRYTFQPLEKRGVLLGLGAAQLASILGGLVAAVLVVQSLHGAAGAVAALAVVAASGGFALLHHHGLPLVKWVPVASGWAARRSGGPALSSDPPSGTPATYVVKDAVTAQVPARPRVSRRTRAPRRTRPASRIRVTGLAGTKVVEVPPLPGQAGFGAIVDSRRSSAVAVVPVFGGSLALLDADEQARRVDAWRAVLASLARSAGSMRRIQWIESSFPIATSTPPRVWDGHEIGPWAEARASYVELLGSRDSSRAHEVWLAIAVSYSRARRLSDLPYAEALRRELRLLEGQLRRADLVPEAPMSPARLTSVLGVGGGPGCSGAMATVEQWSAVRRDGDLHATYWIAEWPRVDVGPDFLSPLLISDGRRRVSLVMAPVPLERAVRQARSARTADLADEEIRARAGFLPSARRRREADGATFREEELAAGHVEYRFSGYVTVTASDPEALAHACAEAEQSAQEAHLELRRLYGRQEEAFSWTLPLTRGLG